MGEKLPRDKRVDAIGYVNELQKQYSDNLKSQIKCAMLEREQERVTGDAFEGLLIEGQKQTVDPAKLFRLVKAGEISEKDFVAAITVSATAARKLMSEKELLRISDLSATSPALRVSRIKGVEISIVSAIQSINEAVLK